MCHPDEFLYHEPELVARNLGVGCSLLTWYAVQVVVRSGSTPLTPLTTPTRGTTFTPAPSLGLATPTPRPSPAPPQ